MALRYLGEVFSHHDGSYEKFFYCDQHADNTVRMRNIHDTDDTRSVPVATAERVYVRLTGDVLERLVSKEAVAVAVARYSKCIACRGPGPLDDEHCAQCNERRTVHILRNVSR